MLDAPQISLLIDLNTLFACKPHEWLEFSSIGHCFVPQAVHRELEVWASHRLDTTETKIAREYCRFMLESDWHLTYSPISAQTNRPFTRRARLAIEVRNSAQELAKSSPEQLIVVISNDRALLQQVQALQIDNLTGIPVSTFLTWSRTKRQPPVVIQRVRSLQTHALQLLTVGHYGRSRPVDLSPHPKLAPTPVYQSQWFDRLLPIVLILGGLALGWSLAQPLIQQVPPILEQE